MKIDKTKLIIILVGFLDILGIGIIIPTLPDLATYYGVSAHAVSLGVTVYALFAFLAAPVLGQLSDVFGRKKILTICIIGSFVSALAIAGVQSYWFFVIGRMINGITGGNISILQAIISDISKNKEDRAANMGILGALFGSAFIVGPLIGGFLLNFGVSIPYRFMAVFSLLEIFVVIFIYKETNQHIMPKKVARNPFEKIIFYLKKPSVNVFILSLISLLLAFTVYQSILSLYLNENYGLTGAQTGYVMAGFGIVMVLNQAFLLRKFWLKYFKLNNLLRIINIGSMILFTILIFVSSLPTFLLIFVFLVPLQSLVNPVYQSEIVEVADPTNRGEIMGVLSSLQSAAMFIGPLIGGFFITGGFSVFAISIAFVAISLFFVNKIIVQVNSVNQN